MSNILVDLQYLVGIGNPCTLITASICRAIEAISLWHCHGSYGSPGFRDACCQLFFVFGSDAPHFPLDNTA